MSYATTQADLFRQIHPCSMSEDEYEKRILDNAVKSFPKHYVVPCKKGLGGVAADLAMINKNLREWSVVEVEIDDHSFENHILPQVERLVEHDYLSNTDLHAYLVRKIVEVYPDASKDSLLDMLCDVVPTVKVMLSSHCENHMRNLQRNSIEWIVVDIFLTRESHPMLKVNGRFPELDKIHVGELIPHPWGMRGSYSVDLKDQQYSIQSEYFIAYFEEMLCEFKRYHTSDGLVVRPIGRCPWGRSPKKLYVLADNLYLIE